MSLLELKGVSFQYHGAQKSALENISITIQKNDCILICGHDDAGKSTLGMILKGLIPQLNLGSLKGEVLFNDQPLNSLSLRDQVLKIGYLFTHPTSQMSMLKETVLDEIAFSCENLNFDREETLFRVKAMSRLCEITPFLTSTLESCSLGMLQRVALASMLVLDPDVIIFDEPCVHLDQAGQQFFIKLCHDLKKQGKTLIILDHSLTPYYEITDQVFVLETGKIVHHGSVVEKINAHYLLNSHVHQLVNDVVTTSHAVLTIEEATMILARRLKR
jgi:energy-coupling factor transporter ATP-binding protein EcfA2